MNVLNLTFKKIAVCVLALLPIIGWSQGYQQHQMLEDDTYEQYFFSSVEPNSSNNPAPASHGTTEIDYYTTINGQLQYVFRYTPEPGFLGKDSTSFIFFTGLNTPNYVYLEIEVVESQVEATDDYTTMVASDAVFIDVLANDQSSTGSKTITALPVVNNGTAVIDSTQRIIFTPDHGFVGVARLHYTVCDDEGSCDIGLATVFVEEGFTSNDTIEVFATKNSPVNILIPTAGGYFTQRRPRNGTLVSSDPSGIMVYTPNTGFTGVDQFTSIYLFNGIPSIRPYKVTVLEAPEQNDLVLSDHFFTGINQTITVDVLENDLGNLNISTYSDPEYGTLTQEGNDFNYQPDAEFEGLDQFTYLACVGSSAVCEQTVVYITVSDQEPGAVVFELSTPMNTPLVIDYDIPNKNWDFSLSFLNSNQTMTTPGGGQLEYFPGVYEGDPIAGQVVEGYNIMVYTPPSNAVLTDGFEVYFVTDAGTQLVKIEVAVNEAPGGDDPYCVTDCIWPGDVNRDGVVDITDLLPLGYCIGETGPARDNGSGNWYGQHGDDWGRTIGNTTVDFKHIDTNGDGVVTAADTIAIGTHYGRNNGLTPRPTPATEEQPLLFIPRNEDIQPGDLVIIDIMFGTENNPILDANGLTFSINYNSAIVVPGTVNIDFDESSWLHYDAPTIAQVASPYFNRVDAGLTRTEGRGANGYGVVGTLSFIIIEDIDGTRPGDEMNINTNVTNSTTMNSSGNLVGLTSYDPTLTINFKEDTPTTEADLLAFPNPAQSHINLHLNGNDEILELEMFRITGQKVYEDLNVNSNQHTINVSGAQFSNGMYLIQAKTEEGFVTKKVQVMR